MILPSDSPPSLQTAMGSVEREYQKKSHVLFKSAPFAKDVPENGFVLALISGTLYVYTRVDQTLYRSALTKV